MRKIVLFTMLMVFTPGFLSAQRNCGSMEVLEIKLQEDPKLQEKMDRIQRHTKNIENNPLKAVTGVITIPTVVHVVYANNTQNISAAQVQSQIDILNEDFRRTNSDANNNWSQAADSEIEFCLASVDPNGQATNGITRTSTNVSSHGTNDSVKRTSSGGIDAWDASQYLNIWVCNIGDQTLGYAQFPGGSPSTDGVVIGYQYFGNIGTASAPFDLGRTGTHEVGHWLNLRHIWGDGGCNVDDLVSDTPQSDGANYQCASTHSSCSSLDMVQNYMDYSDDACMNLFTAGQSTRMRALFDTGGSKASFLNSPACGGQTTSCSDGIQNGNEAGVDCGGPCAACPCAGEAVTLSITLDDYPAETSWSITDANGATVASGGTYGNVAAGSTLTGDLCLNDGCYDLTVNDIYGDGICCEFGNGSYALTNGGTTLVSGGSFASSETTNFCISNVLVPTCTDGVQNGDETGVDCGGSCAPCQTECSDVTISNNGFEAGGWGIWTDHGSDCARIWSPTYANNGNRCLRLRDNSNSSATSTATMDLSSFDEITVSFSYLARSFDNANEDFWLMISSNGGSSFTIVEEWNQSDEFLNLVRYDDSVTIPGPFTSTTQIRFRCDASANNDLLYLDDIVLSGCQRNARLGREEIFSTGLLRFDPEAASTPAIEQRLSSEQDLRIYPNPATELVNVNLGAASDSPVTVSIIGLNGRILKQEVLDSTQVNEVVKFSTSGLDANIYFIRVESDGAAKTEKFVIMK